jgi:hypothetical protein
MMLAGSAAAGAAEVGALRCDDRSNPLGVDDRTPPLSWGMECVEPKGGDRGQAQTAYQVLVASTPALLAKNQGDLWDSGKVRSAQSLHVRYAGKHLASRQLCHWKVRIWDRNKTPSAWSENATWTMGVLAEGDWNAQWIGVPSLAVPPSASIQLRREFELDRAIKRAVVAVCGLGLYELRLNGQKIGDQVLAPGWTNYRKTCLYTMYDVTAQLTRGRNALGIILGNGMYNVPGGRYTKFKGTFGPLKALVNLTVEYTDGTCVTVATDDTWQWAPSPVVFTCVYGGEDYDARKEVPGWDRAGLGAGAFRPALVVEGPGGKLSAQVAPPIKVMQEYKPVRVTQPKPGVWIYDFGQNCSSMPKLTVKGPAGASVRLTPGELLDGNGLVSQRNCGGPTYYTYTMKGAGAETWMPRFFYYGSRYLQVETSGHEADNAPQVVELVSQFVHASAATVGTFECANPLVNRIHGLIDAAIKSNLQSVLTDCPHREKLGWLECSHLLAGCVMYNYGVQKFWAKIINDMSEAQLPNGNKVYTRDGEFHPNAQGQLVTKQGYIVQGLAGAIQLDPNNASPVAISASGEVSQGGVSRGTLKAVDFNDYDRLTGMGGGYFLANDPALVATPTTKATFVQGYLESSNTSTVAEMVNLISSSRMFEANQKVAQIEDERMGRLISDVGNPN